MLRKDIYRIIEGERQFQESQDMPNQKSVREWLDSIYYYMTAPAKTEEAFLPNLRKIAALAVAAMEQHGAPPRKGFDLLQPAQEPSRDWTPMDLAVHAAIISMGTWEEPLDETLKDLTLGQWQLERARRVIRAVQSFDPPLWYQMGYDEESIRQNELD